MLALLSSLIAGFFFVYLLGASVAAAVRDMGKNQLPSGMKS
jgi:hypothetical protein